MSGDDTTGGPSGRRRGHLRGVRGESGSRTPDGSGTGHEDERNAFELGGGTVDDNSFSVPDLLATDALLDRLGRHETTDGDLADAVARLLDSYALNADPETAGVRPVELPDLDAEADAPAAHVSAPRVLLARRRTLQRLGRGTVAAAAVLTLLGGTAAAAATSVNPLGGGDGSVTASIASQLPGWFPDTVFSVFAGSPTERVQRELVQARADALAGDSAAAKARLKYLQEQLGDTSVDPALVLEVQETLADLEDDDLGGLAGGAPSGTPTTAPVGSPTPSTPGTLLEGVATVVPGASPTNTWRVPMQTGRVTGSETQAPSTPPASTPGTTPGTGSTPPRTTPPPVVQPAPPGTGSGSGGGTGAPGTPTDTPPSPSDPPSSGPTDVPTGTPTGPGTGTTTDPGTGTPTDTGGSTPTDGSTPTGETGGSTPTTAPTDSTDTPTQDPGDGVGTDPVDGSAPVIVTPTLPVVEPSPSTGVLPSPGDPAGSGADAAPEASADSAVTSGS